MKPSSCCVVCVTAPSDRAASIARLVVERRLAACVNIVPSVRSVYHWEGRICDDEESLLIAKTSASQFEQLRQLVVEAHPYDLPEVIALPIDAGHPPYLEWILRTTSL